MNRIYSWHDINLLPTGVVQKRPMPVSAAVSSNDATLGLSSAVFMWWFFSRFIVSRNCPFITVNLLCWEIVVVFVVVFTCPQCAAFWRFHEVGWSLDPTAGAASPVGTSDSEFIVTLRFSNLHELVVWCYMNVWWHHITFKHIRHIPTTARFPCWRASCCVMLASARLLMLRPSRRLSLAISATTSLCHIVDIAFPGATGSVWEAAACSLGPEEDWWRPGNIATSKNSRNSNSFWYSFVRTKIFLDCEISKLRDARHQAERGRGRTRISQLHCCTMK